MRHQLHTTPQTAGRTVGTANPPRTRGTRMGRQGFMTLTEVVVVSFLSTLVIAAVMRTLITTSDAVSHAIQRTTALCLCVEKLESMRAAVFSQGTQANYPEEAARSLTHTQTVPEYRLPCTRRVTVEDISTAGVGAKRVTVQVQWRFRNAQRSETVYAIIYDMS